MLKTFHAKCSRFLLPVITVLVFFSCQKNINDFGPTVPGETPDLVTKVTSSVSGFVTDENNAAVLGAQVNVGGNTTTTDKYGYFEVRNVQVVKNAAVVTVTQTGYFKGIKTYLAENNKAAFFRIKLIPKTTSGNINSASGGNVTLTNGLIVALPADAVVKASDNSAYTGTINVAAHWIDPVSTDLNAVMPGDLRGISTEGYIKLLTTYGMAAVELTSASGELLQIAPGKKATLTFPIPAALSGTAPTTIPLWSFDESKGLWKQDGTATKTGNTYVGEVSHFSFWNCDVPNNYIQFECTVKDQSGTPIPYAVVKISVVGSPYNAGYGITDSSGYVHGAIPNDAQLLLEVFTNWACNSAVYSQNFSSGNTNMSLGTISVNNTQGAAHVTGTITNCASAPVTNGYLIMAVNGNIFYRYALDNSGAFDFNTILCGGNPASVTFIGEDYVSLQQSTPLTYTLNPGNNPIGNLQACGLSIAEFITYTVDGTPTVSLAAPIDSVMQWGNGTSNTFLVNGSANGPSANYISFSVETTGMAVGSTQVLQYIYTTQLSSQNITVTNNPVVQITELGAIGQFIAGNFSANILDNTTSTNHTIVCSFRVRRSI